MNRSNWWDFSVLHGSQFSGRRNKILRLGVWMCLDSQRWLNCQGEWNQTVILSFKDQELVVDLGLMILGCGVGDNCTGIREQYRTGRVSISVSQY